MAEIQIEGAPAGAQTTSGGQYRLVVNSDGSINTAISGNTGAVANTTYTTVQVSPTGTAGTLIAASATRKVLMLRSLSTNTQSVWIGAATVTATTGFELKPGEQIVFTGADVPVTLMQAITTSGTQVIVVTTGV